MTHAALSALINSIPFAGMAAVFAGVILRFVSRRSWNATTRERVWWAVLLVSVVLPFQISSFVASPQTDAVPPVRPGDAVVHNPAPLLETLNESELDQICLHELAHFQRRDDYWLLLQRVIEALLSFIRLSAGSPGVSISSVRSHAMTL